MNRWTAARSLARLASLNQNSEARRVGRAMKRKHNNEPFPAHVSLNYKDTEWARLRMLGMPAVPGFGTLMRTYGDRLSDQGKYKGYTVEMYGVDVPLAGEAGRTVALSGYERGDDITKINPHGKVDMWVWLHRVRCDDTPAIYQEIYTRDSVFEAGVSKLEQIPFDKRAEHTRIIMRGLPLIPLMAVQQSAGRRRRFESKADLLAAMEQARLICEQIPVEVTPANIAMYIEIGGDVGCDIKTLKGAMAHFQVNFEQWGMGKI